MIWGWVGQPSEVLLKNKKLGSGEGNSSVIEGVLSMHKALGSIPGTSVKINKINKINLPPPQRGKKDDCLKKKIQLPTQDWGEKSLVDTWWCGEELYSRSEENQGEPV